LIGTTLNVGEAVYNYQIDGINVHRIGLSEEEKKGILPFVLLYYPLMSIAIPKIASALETHISPFAAHADFIHNIRIGREPLSYASYNVARHHDIPFIFTPIHHPRWKNWRYRAYLKLYRLADAVIALTETERQMLLELGVKSERLFVTGAGPVLTPQANPKRFIEKYSINGPFVLFLGQHYPYKGYRHILGAAKLVWNKIADIHFVFIGPSVGPSEKDFAAFPDQRIHRLGSVELQEKTDALAACELLCVPSTQESFGIVYTEAWSYCKPVIGSNIPAVAEVIQDGVDGYLVKQDPAEIADRICEIMYNPSRAHAMGIAGKLKVQERYNWQRIAELTEQIYQKVLGRK
jgi:glycosyltransferase involved in cell wall biosynthesis